MQNSVIPVVVVIDPFEPTPNQTVTITVTVIPVADSDQPIGISCSVGGYFTNLPSSVEVQSGHNQVAFQATVSSGASGAASVIASANGVQASGACLVTSG